MEGLCENGESRNGAGEGWRSQMFLFAFGSELITHNGWFIGRYMVVPEIKGMNLESQRLQDRKKHVGETTFSRFPKDCVRLAADSKSNGKRVVAVRLNDSSRIISYLTMGGFQKSRQRPTYGQSELEHSIPKKLDYVRRHEVVHGIRYMTIVQPQILIDWNTTGRVEEVER